MKVSGARSAPENFWGLGVQKPSKTLGNEAFPAREARRKNFGFWGPRTLEILREIKPFGGLGEAWRDSGFGAPEPRVRLRGEEGGGVWRGGPPPYEYLISIAQP